jgi:sulfoxide reductase heme-binding subunit YedZ
VTIDHTYWYLNRAAGLVAYLLLFAAVFLGLSMTGGVLERFLRRYRVYDFHRFVSLLALGATVFHVLIVLPDRFVRFGLLDLLVPFVSSYKPLYTALGIFGLYLMAAIVGAFYVRNLISYRAWRLLHYGTFAAFVLALVHGIGGGTDTQAAWVQYTYAATGLLAFNMLVFRLLKGSARPGKSARSFPARPPAQPPAAIASGVEQS